MSEAISGIAESPVKVKSHRAYVPYWQKLKDPRWQRKRLEILERDGFSCQICGDADSTLHVHHFRYKRNAEPWEYSNLELATLCEDCHESEELQRDQLLALMAYAHPSSPLRHITEAVRQILGRDKWGLWGWIYTAEYPDLHAEAERRWALKSGLYAEDYSI